LILIFKKLCMSLNSSRFPFFLLLSFLAVSIFSCKQKAVKAKQGDDVPVSVDVIVATPQKINNNVEANGTVIANENVDLHPEVSGRLTYLNIPEGKYVTKGTVLARVNSADLEAQYQKSKVQLELQKTTEERLRKLLSVNGINQSDYDAALNAVNSTKADMDYTQTLIDKTVIRAPFDGTLGLRQVSPGAYVSPTTVLVTLQQLGTLIKVGAKVDVEVDAAKEIMQSATIIAVEPQVNNQTRNLLIRAILSGNKSNPGAFVKVYVGSHDAGKMAVMVPTNAIIPNDLNNQLVVIKNGKAEFVNISTGARSANNVEVTKGVNAGDTVVVTGVLFAKPNAPVKVRNVKSLAEVDKDQ